MLDGGGRADGWCVLDGFSALDGGGRSMSGGALDVGA